MEQSLAGLISDRATDEVVDALTRYRRGLGITDSPSMHLEDPQTPDIVRSRSNQVKVNYFTYFAQMIKIIKSNYLFIGCIGIFTIEKFRLATI